MVKLFLLPLAATVKTGEVLEGVGGHVVAGDVVHGIHEDHGVRVVGGQGVLYLHQDHPQ